MSGNDLFEGMSFIDERFVDEAWNNGLPRHIPGPWLRVASVAACLCLVLFSLWCIHPTQSGPPPETTAPYDPFLPEGYPEVILYVEEMTEEGFIGTVAELVSPDLFEIGMELNVVLEENTWYERADGSSGCIQDQAPDLSGCYVLVLCTEYDSDTAYIAVNTIWEVQPPDPTS